MTTYAGKTSDINNQTQQMLQNALEYIESLSPEQFEEDLRSVGVSSIRKDRRKCGGHKTNYRRRYDYDKHARRKRVGTDFATAWGFGISTAQQVKAVASVVDGLAFRSALNSP